MNKVRKNLIPLSRIEKAIFPIRGEKVILYQNLAGMYGVGTRALVQAVKRNTDRFPADFMFELSKDEFSRLASQIVTSSWGGRRTRPYAFTEECVAMLSSVLGSKRALLVSIEIGQDINRHHCLPRTFGLVCKPRRPSS